MLLPTDYIFWLNTVQTNEKNISPTNTLIYIRSEKVPAVHLSNLWTNVSQTVATRSCSKSLPSNVCFESIGMGGIICLHFRYFNNATEYSIISGFQFSRIRRLWSRKSMWGSLDQLYFCWGVTCKDGLKIPQGLHERVDYLVFPSCTINVHQDERCCPWMTWMGSRRSKIKKKDRLV